ncbi:YciI family protein [Nocardioides cynanchi]|uniref:YciI family protein n=1 Tax=Nocardioides cynanchi TaxID=2558918 RepID=UPI001244AB81|nr:YciI family protein [Nocardioides cynanchi]
MFAVQLSFSDDPARLDHRPAHRERLAELAADGRLLAAGPWSDESGALLVFLADDRAEVDAIIAADPYYAAPGVEVAGVHEWNPVTRHRALADL